MSKDSGRAGWRSSLDDEAQASITSAVEQLVADEAYEGPQGPKVRDTLSCLSKLEQQANSLIETIDDLSPVGQAAMFEAGEDRRLREGKDERQIYTGRYKLRDLQRELDEIAASAQTAAAILVQMHSPFPDPDARQGIGSAIGRDSDLRAIRVDHDQSTKLPPFRSPKDKFAVKAIMTFIDAGLDPRGRGASKILRHCLDDIWAEFRDGPPPNWARPIKARHAIAEWAAKRRKSREVWKKAVAKGNATSLQNGKMPT